MTSKIKHAIKHKTSPARLAQLLHPRTGRYAVIGCKLKQNANEGCNSCATVVQVCFIACFVLLVIAPLAALVAVFCDSFQDFGTNIPGSH